MLWISFQMRGFRFKPIIGILLFGDFTSVSLPSYILGSLTIPPKEKYQSPKSESNVRLILLSILNCKMDNFLAHFGLVCSSFVTISKGTHWRYLHDPLGRAGVKFVDASNHMTAKFLVISVNVNIVLLNHHN